MYFKKALLPAMAAALVGLFTGGFTARAADDAEDFYRGRTISIYVGLPAGGDYDSYARLVAAHVGRFLPGSPSVIVQNMTGAGSLLAANYLYNVASQDGSAIGALSSNIAMQPLLDATGVKYDVLKFNWLPVVAASPNVLVVSQASPIKQFADLHDRKAVLATVAPGSSPTITIGLYKHVLGARVRAILGYAGIQAAMLAVERGEVDGYPTVPFDTLKRTYEQQWKSGKLRVLAISGSERNAELPDVPTMEELAASDDDRRLLRLATTSNRMTFNYVMGPGVPKNRVEAMRAAFMTMFDDARFKEESEKQLLPVTPVAADKLEAIIRDAYATPPEIVQRLQKIVALQGN